MVSFHACGEAHEPRHDALLAPRRHRHRGVPEGSLQSAECQLDHAVSELLDLFWTTTRLWIIGIRRKDAKSELVEHLGLFLQICADSGEPNGEGGHWQDTGYKGRQTRLDKRKARNSTLGNMTDQLHHCKRVLRAVTRQPRTVCALSLAAQRHIRQLVSRRARSTSLGCNCSGDIVGDVIQGGNSARRL